MKKTSPWGWDDDGGGKGGDGRGYYVNPPSHYVRREADAPSPVSMVHVVLCYHSGKKMCPFRWGKSKNRPREGGWDTPRKEWKRDSRAWWDRPSPYTSA